MARLLAALAVACCSTAAAVESSAQSLAVSWYAPFFSGGGYCSEATAFVLELATRLPLRIVQHGDAYNYKYLEGLPSATVHELQRLNSKGDVQPHNSVTICHSEPGAWSPPGQPRSSWEHVTCPPPNAAYSVGRTMFETDRLPDGWAPRLNAMDEIWVPSRHSFDTFAAGGVLVSKLFIVGEPIDTEFFHPDRTGKPYELPADSTDRTTTTRFISVFKWEARKAWDVLLGAFFGEFSSADGVVLYLLTNPYHNEGLDFEAEVERFASRLKRPVETLPRVEILPRGVPQSRLPALLNAMDAFVLPSRGEGWGRPHVEAMAMGLPIIATNWSGPTEFMTEENGYPVALDYGDDGTGDGLVEIDEGAFKGHRWAAPSVESLRGAMRSVVEGGENAKRKGNLARRTMEERFTPGKLAGTVEGHVARIAALLAAWGGGADREL